MSDIPDELDVFFSRLGDVTGAAATERIRHTMTEPKRAGYWVNPLADGMWETQDPPVPGLPGCYSVAAPDRAELLNREETSRGKVYPVNPASVDAVNALDPQPGQEVLDLAAAPGGKTLIMAAKMHNEGRIAAVEPVRGRFHRMRANLNRCGVTNTAYYLEDGRRIGRKVPGRFDRVLLDAPCSSESRFRLADPETYRHWKPRKVKECARKQRGLIRSAFQALKPGGYLVYSTCSFAPEENELVVSYLLNAEVAAVPVEFGVTAPDSVPGLTCWREKNLDARLSRARRVLPDELWDGFFICLIRKDPAV
jgi:16S rRNA (cytosine1407-C5)-methyltransferase